MESPAERAYRVGLYTRALEILERDAKMQEEVLYCQVLQLVGSSAEAANRAEQAISRGHTCSADKARLAGVVAGHLYERGDMGLALEWWRRALASAEESRDPAVIGTIAVQLLERVCDGSGFSSSLPLAARVRRATVRAADPHATTIVHLTFGRLEARHGRYDTARRHFAVARALLDAFPNESLIASLNLDESSLLMLVGDPERAIELAKAGAAAAETSGWAKGKCAANANLACLFTATDQLALAERHLDLARKVGFTSTSYEIALADTEAQIAMSRGLFDRAEAILRRIEATGDRVSLHYMLYARHTLARLWLHLGRSHEALQLADSCKKEAIASGAFTLAELFDFIESEARADLGLGRIDLPASTTSSGGTTSLSLLGSEYLLSGRMLSTREGGVERAVSHVRRALMILGSAVNKPAEIQASAIHQRLAAAGDADLQKSSSSYLDAAVALLELAGHPHILGREAFILIQQSGCASAVALAAVTAAQARIVLAHGWTQEEALAALRAAQPEDVITVGVHRDETWQLLAAPRAGLDERCTLAAIRKLVAAAVTLDRYRRDEKQRAALWPAETLEGDPESIWASEQAAEILSIARRIAPTSLPVLLTGETGTGKEMLARAIHKASDRADRAFVPFNCSAVPRDMIESQLFGYRKGAFTGADRSFSGVIRASAGGTIFLDEIADVPMELQAKLLRFLEHQEVQPLGEAQPIRVDVRIVAATNANLEQLVAQGRFREDLLYRLNVIQLRIPPLRERREEIPTLIQHYIRRYSLEQKKGDLSLSDETLEYLLLYAWPGNIRQLANEVRRMVALAEPDSTLTPALLSPEIQASRRTIPASADPQREIRLTLDQPLPAAVERLEQMLVRYALERTRGRVEEAAKLLGISRKGLFLKRRRWGLPRAS